MNYEKIINYSYSDMEYLDNNIKPNIKDFSLVRDFVIKEILSKNRNIYKEIIVLLIRDIIRLDKDNTSIVFENIELGKSNYKEYNKVIDSYIKLNNNIHIDFECNTSPYNNVKLRNILYLNKMSTKVLESGNNINKLNNIYLIQININASLFDDKFGYEVYSLLGKNFTKKLTNFEHILVFNIEYYRKLFYNEFVNLKKFEMWLVVLSSKNFKELYNSLNYVVSPSKRNKIIKDVIDMFSDGFRLCDWEKDKMIELVKQTTIYNAKEEAKKEGKQENIISIIRAMLSENCSLSLISKVTGKSLKEIRDIKNTII